jgi:hypothetical protein
MRDMNILNEIADFKRLSGLLTESIAGALRILPTGWLDEFITPTVRASDSKIDDIAYDISRGGIRSLTDDQLIYLLSKLPAEQVAKKLVDTNVFFSPANVDSLLQGYLNRLTRGDMSWDEIVLEMQRGKRTIWGQSPNIPDSVYDDISDIMDDVTRRYINDVEDFIRKNGDPKTAAKLPKSILKKVDEILDTFPNWLKGATATVRPFIDRFTKNIDVINKERDELFKTISSKIADDGASANIKGEVRRLTELASAAKKNNNLTGKEVLDRWLSESGMSRLDRQQFFAKDEWYNTWSKLVSDEANKTAFQSYWDTITKLYPFQKITKDGVVRRRITAETKDWFRRMGNLLVYASPYTRRELAARMAAKGVGATQARRLAAQFLLYNIYWPAAFSIFEWVKHFLQGGENKNIFDLVWENIKEQVIDNDLVLNWTNLDSAWNALTTESKDARTAFDESNQIYVDAKTAEQILEGEYTPDEEDSNTAKSNGVRRYIKNKYSDIPNDYLPRIHVGNNNKVYFTQITGGGRTNIPLALINGEIYLINKQANKKIRFDKIWTTLNEGLINILKEQEIDWGSGESIDDNIDLDTVDDVATSDWREIVGLGGDEDGDTSGSEEDGDSGVDLSFLGGSGSSGPKWEFNRNPTGQMRTDRDAARLDADGYTKGNIYVYKKPDGTEELVLAGKLVGGTPHLFKVEKNDSGKWGWINDSQDPPMWEEFKDY